jgi:hypothetical protein
MVLTLLGCLFVKKQKTEKHVYPRSKMTTGLSDFHALVAGRCNRFEESSVEVLLSMWTMAGEGRRRRFDLP